MSTTAIPAPGDSVALLLNSVSTAAATGQPAPPASGASVPAATQASLATEAGVIATLSTAAAPTDSTTQLYDNLAALSASTGNPAPAAADAAAGAPQGAVNVNAEWASVLQSTPALAPVAAQMGVDAAIVDTLA